MLLSLHRVTRLPQTCIIVNIVRTAKMDRFGLVFSLVSLMMVVLPLHVSGQTYCVPVQRTLSAEEFVTETRGPTDYPVLVRVPPGKVNRVLVTDSPTDEAPTIMVPTSEPIIGDGNDRAAVFKVGNVQDISSLSQDARDFIVRVRGVVYITPPHVVVLWVSYPGVRYEGPQDAELYNVELLSETDLGFTGPKFVLVPRGSKVNVESCGNSP